MSYNNNNRTKMKELKKYCPPQTIALKMEEDEMICAGSTTISGFDGGSEGGSTGTISGEESLSKENNASSTWSVWDDKD